MESEDDQDSSDADIDDDIAKVRHNLNQIFDQDNDFLSDSDNALPHQVTPSTNTDTTFAENVHEQPPEPQPSTSKSVRSSRNKSSIIPPLTIPSPSLKKKEI